MKKIEIDEEALQDFLNSNELLHDLILANIDNQNNQSVLETGKQHITTLMKLLASIKDVEQ